MGQSQKSDSLTHVRASLDARADSAAFASIRDHARPDQRLELGLRFDEQGGVSDDLIARVCADNRVERILLLQVGRTVITKATAERAYDALERHGCRIPITTAVDGYFVEVNRGVPVDIISEDLAVAVCPTVHSGDPFTVTENIGALPAIVRTARELFPGREVTVSPLTLHLGPAPDPDVYRLVALPWFIASLESIGHLGLLSVTLGSDVLPDPAEHPSLARAWESVLTLLATARHSATTATTAQPRELLHAVAWQQPDEQHVLVANLADQDQLVTLDGETEPHHVQCLWAPHEPTPRPDAPSREFVVPAYGVVHVQTRAA